MSDNNPSPAAPQPNRALLPLEKCPFCGSEAQLYEAKHYWKVVCTNFDECGLGTLPLSMADGAIAMWNRRIPEPPAPAVVLDGTQVCDEREDLSDEQLDMLCDQWWRDDVNASYPIGKHSAARVAFKAGWQARGRKDAKR